MSKLGKDDVINALTESTKQEKPNVKKVIEALFPLVKAELRKGNEVTLGDLLIFKPKLRKARKVRNPKTGETKMAPEKKVVKIKVRKMLKKIFEEGGEKTK